MLLLLTMTHVYTLRRFGRPNETVGLTERGRQYVTVFRSADAAQAFARGVPANGNGNGNGNGGNGLWLDESHETYERDVSLDVDLVLASRGKRRSGVLAAGPVVIRTGVRLCSCARKTNEARGDASDMFDVHELPMDDALLLPLEKRIGVIMPSVHAVQVVEDEILWLDCTVIQAWRSVRDPLPKTKEV